MISIILAMTVMPQVTLGSLIDDATDLATLAEYPNPPYTTRQASSYDPASKEAGNEGWFANKDWGNFVREEVVSGRKEHVLIDVQGPGAMVRYWTPNPSGVTRIYIDGSPKPVVEAKTLDLLSGKVAPFFPPMAEETSKGWSLYCPITYQKSLKVTVDDTDSDAGKNMYYQVQYRTYEKSVIVEAYNSSAVKDLHLPDKISHVPERVYPAVSQSAELKPGQRTTVFNDRPIVIKSLVVMLPTEAQVEWSDPLAMHNVLRNLRVLGTFDGELCIDAPLGDLMGSPIGLTPVTTLPAVVGGQIMVLNLPMPCRESVKIELVNNGGATVSTSLSVESAPYKWTERSMHFKAQWKCFKGNSRPMIDLDFLHAEGQGVFVGCNASISNPVQAWWGEGDEKMYVDGETFPSTFGTGTEDYFGYGWCDRTLFNHPYHYQSRCDGPGNKGHTSVGRWQILDRIPFTKSFRFDMELWHWAETDLLYGRTAFWYAKPGGSGPRSDDATKFPIPLIDSGVKQVKGVIEGENMKVLACTGGTTELQSFENLSNGKQLWWRDGAANHELRLAVPVPAKGRYRVYGRFCTAGDYGIHDIWFGTISRQIDFYGKLGWKTIDLGTTYLDKSDAVPFRVRVHGANPKAEPRHMFGLDYLVLVRED